MVAITEAMREAGNYPKEHIRFKGLDISIETKKGKRRKPDWPPMPADYGYIKRTEGRDGDHVDVFVGPHDSDLVVVVDQVTESGRFDEHKCMLGFRSRNEAVEVYKSAYTPGWKVGPVTTMTIEQFKNWIKEGNTMKRIEPQVSEYSAAAASITEQFAARIAEKQHRLEAPERARLIADILYHFYGDDAENHLDEVVDQYAAVFKPGMRVYQWDEDQHPRNRAGKFAKKNTEEHVAAVHSRVEEHLKGNRSPESARELHDHLSTLTVANLNAIKSKYGIAAGGRNKSELVAKIAKRMDAGRREAANVKTPSKWLDVESGQKPPDLLDGKADQAPDLLSGEAAKKEPDEPTTPEKKTAAKPDTAGPTPSQAAVLSQVSSFPAPKTTYQEMAKETDRKLAEYDPKDPRELLAANNDKIADLDEILQPLYKSRDSIEKEMAELRSQPASVSRDSKYRGAKRRLDSVNARIKPHAEQHDKIREASQGHIAAIRDQEKKTEPKPTGIEMPTKAIDNAQAKTGDQLGLFGEGRKKDAPDAKAGFKGAGSTKQNVMFDGLKDDPNQAFLFGEMDASGKQAAGDRPREETTHEDRVAAVKEKKHPGIIGNAFNKAKKQHPGKMLAFRMGDFYEMHYEDAEAASKKLGLTLTTRSSPDGKVPMVGFPYHQLDGYMKKMGDQMVAIEPEEVAKGTKGKGESGPSEGPKDGDRNADGLVFHDGRWHREESEAAKPEAMASKSTETPKDEPKEEKSGRHEPPLSGGSSPVPPAKESGKREDPKPVSFSRHFGMMKKESAYANKPSVGERFEHKGQMYEITKVQNPRYHSRSSAEDMEDIGHFGVKPGWHVSYEAKPVDTTDSEANAKSIRQSKENAVISINNLVSHNHEAFKGAEDVSKGGSASKPSGEWTHTASLHINSGTSTHGKVDGQVFVDDNAAYYYHPGSYDDYMSTVLKQSDPEKVAKIKSQIEDARKSLGVNRESMNGKNSVQIGGSAMQPTKEELSEAERKRNEKENQSAVQVASKASIKAKEESPREVARHSATWSRLKSGEWGARIQSSKKPAKGDIVTVKAKSGRIEQKKVEQVAWSGDGVHLVTVYSASMDCAPPIPPRPKMIIPYTRTRFSPSSARAMLMARNRIYDGN